MPQGRALRLACPLVMLQAMKEDLPTNAKCKDKFLIQSTTITPEKESMSLQDMASGVYVAGCP